jgi:hypothetical protein
MRVHPWRYERRYVLIIFDPLAWRDVAHLAFPLYLLLLLLCDWLAPGWAARLGLAPHLDWWHPETWWHAIWRTRL